MGEKIHQCMDGEIPRPDLTPEQRGELEVMERAIRETLVSLQRAPVPDVTASVMERIEASERSRAPAESDASAPSPVRAAVGGLLRWLWTPRPVRLRPAWALGGVIVFGLGLGLLPLETSNTPAGDSAEAARTANASEKPVLWVRFHLEAPEAASVHLAGTFTGWKPRYELAPTGGGVWSVLVPLRPGVHEYSFVVDGERWMADPHAPAVDDGFGGVNSRIGVLAPGAGRSS